MSGEFANAGAIKATIDFDSAGLEAAVKKAMSQATSQVTQQIDSSMAEVEGRITSGFKGVGAGLLGYLGITSIADAVGKVGGYILGVGRDTEKALNTFQAVSGATGAEMEKVADQAKALGSDASLAGVSAGDAALAMTELAKSGFTVEEAMAASKGVLQLATAAQTDAGTAAQIAASQIQAFGLEAKDAGKVADLLANAANITAADMQGMADSMNQVGAVAHASGLSLAETAGVVALMADNAIVGSDAGTSLKSMLMALQAPSGEAQAIMSKLGIDVYDAAGNMRSMAGITRELTDGTKGLTQEQKQHALATIFGSDAIRTVNVLMAEGADGVRDLTGAIQKEGAAAALADANTKGFTGALDAFQNILDGVAEEIYHNVAPALEEKLRAVLEDLPGMIETTSTFLGEMLANLRPMGQVVAEVLDAFQPAGVIATKAAFGALLGATQILAAIFTPLAEIIEANEGAFKGLVTTVVTATLAYKALTGVASLTRKAMASPEIAAARANFTRLRGSITSATAAMSALRASGAGMTAAMGGPWGIALAGATLAIGAYAANQAEAKAHIESLTTSLDEQTGALSDNTREIVTNALESAGVLEAAKALGISLGDVTDAALGNEAALSRVNAALEAHVTATGEASSEYENANSTVEAYGKAVAALPVEEATNEVNKIRGAITGQNEAINEATGSWKRAQEANREFSVAAEVAGHALGRGTEEFRRGGNVSTTYSTAIREGTEAVQGMGREAVSTRISVEGLNNEFVTGVNETIQFEQAIDDAAAKIKDIGKKALTTGGQFDLNRQEGRDLASALANVAAESDGVAGATTRARNQMIQMIRPLVNSRKEAVALVDQFFNTRSSMNTTGDSAAGAAGKFERLNRGVESLKGDKVSVSVDTPGIDQSLLNIQKFNAAVRAADAQVVSVPFVTQGGMVRGNAAGGPIFGEGTGTSDSELRRLSHGEHVVTASEVKAAGGHGNIMRLRQMLSTGTVPVASGGGGALVDELNVSVGDKRDLPEAMNEALFHLRRIRRGGRYADL